MTWKIWLLRIWVTVEWLAWMPSRPALKIVLKLTVLWLPQT